MGPRQFVQKQPVLAAALTGALAAGALPVLSTMIETAICRYALSADFLGPLVFTAGPMFAGFLVGAVCGGAGALLGQGLANIRAGRYSLLTGAAAGILLAAAADFLFGFLSAALIMFPDC